MNNFSTPFHTPAKKSFFPHQIAWAYSFPAFLSSSSAGLTVNFPIRFSSEPHFSSSWITGKTCFHLASSALSITVFSYSPVPMPLNEDIDIIRKEKKNSSSFHLESCNWHSLLNKVSFFSFHFSLSSPHYHIKIDSDIVPSHKRDLSNYMEWKNKQESMLI